MVPVIRWGESPGWPIGVPPFCAWRLVMGSESQDEYAGILSPDCGSRIHGRRHGRLVWPWSQRAAGVAVQPDIHDARCHAKYIPITPSRGSERRAVAGQKRQLEYFKTQFADHTECNATSMASLAGSGGAGWRRRAGVAQVAAAPAAGGARYVGLASFHSLGHGLGLDSPR